jgi:hypothetical protein
MRNFARFFFACLWLLALTANLWPCGPSYVSPIFEYEHAPENPYQNFAAGKLGLIKPSQRRIVLLAAYRYLSGGSFSADEQKALVEVWNAEFRNERYEEDDVSETVKTWLEKRKAVVGKEDKTPEIYVEREWGGYEFFPNCTKNAFETATATLSDRIASHGSDDPNVSAWVRAQDQVFANCASGKSIPEPPNETMPEWLRYDRAYQTAAARFYALDYEPAKAAFAAIAADAGSPWQETAEYLVGRTLIRQASLTKDEARTALLYTEAEQNLALVAARGGKFSGSAEKLLGLVKYRLHPQERVRELAQKLTQPGGDNFRQDLIDYNWLIDKFEKETLEAEEKRKADEAVKDGAATSGNAAEGASNTVSNGVGRTTNSNSFTEPEQKEGEIKIYLYADDYSQNWTFYIDADATDEQALAEAEQVVGRPLTDKMKEVVVAARKSGYTGRFSEGRQSEYQGGYYGSETISQATLPDFLRQDDLTDWLFNFQIQSAEAYLYALRRYRQTGSDLWLTSALSKAENSSAELGRLLEDAARVGESSPAYLTVSYHRARILLTLGKAAEARRMLDEILDSALEMPVSTRNRFLALRMQISDNLDDFLKYARRRPFAFDWDGLTGTFDQLIAEQKSWYDPKNENKTREEYEREVENSFREQKKWEDRDLFDAATLDAINRHFPLSALIAAEKSPSLPDYLRERFVLAVWTRAVLLEDFAAAQKFGPALVKFHPELEEQMNQFMAAKTPLGRRRAGMYLILKNPMLSPFVTDPLDKADNEFGSFDSNDWWCEPEETRYDDQGREMADPNADRPSFLTAADARAAGEERKRLAQFGDAPKFYGARVLEWARLAPADKRVPESLYIVWEANGWTKYGCGNNIELRTQIGNVLLRKYPDSEWTKKLQEQEQEQE